MQWRATMVGPRREPFTDEQIITLHEKGMDDVEMAEELGVDVIIARYHRRRLGLKEYRRRYSRTLLFTDQQLIELYEKKFDDIEIGERLGAAKDTVRVRRRRLGLKSHYNKGHRRLFTDQQFKELYEQGFNDVETAGELGVRVNVVSYRRRKLGLKAHSRRRLFTDQQLIELYEKKFDDAEIGEKLGVTRYSICRRRNKLGLKPHTRKR